MYNGVAKRDYNYGTWCMGTHRFIRQSAEATLREYIPKQGFNITLLWSVPLKIGLHSFGLLSFPNLTVLCKPKPWICSYACVSVFACERIHTVEGQWVHTYTRYKRIEFTWSRRVVHGFLGSSVSTSSRLIGQCRVGRWRDNTAWNHLGNSVCLPPLDHPWRQRNTWLSPSFRYLVTMLWQIRWL